MMSKQFYLLGEDVTTAREIDVSPDIELGDLQEIVAAHFGIVEPKGMFLMQSLLGRKTSC